MSHTLSRVRGGISRGAQLRGGKTHPERGPYNPSGWSSFCGLLFGFLVCGDVKNLNHKLLHRAMMADNLSNHEPKRNFSYLVYCQLFGHSNKKSN